MYLTEWKFYDDIIWETADTLRVGAKEVLNDFNKKWSRKYKPVPNIRAREIGPMNKLPARLMSAAFPRTAMRP